MSTTNMEARVERYISLRDTKDRLKKAYQERAAKLDAEMEQLEAQLLRDFNDLGIQNAKTAAGTAYKAVRTSATVADWEAAFAWISENRQWHMLEKRVSKAAVEQFREDNNDIPPGINWREEVTINIRRS